MLHIAASSGCVSTLLEILDHTRHHGGAAVCKDVVSTLLEILDHTRHHGGAAVCKDVVSTLLEILGLVCLVVVGF